jgi:hypothetical protein
LYFRGYEPATIARDFLEYLRRCMLLKIDAEANQILDLPDEQVSEILTQIKDLSSRYLISSVSRVERSIMSLRNSFQARILLESELIRLSLGQEIFAAEELEKRVEALEQKIASFKRFPAGVGAGARPVKTVVPARRRSSVEHPPEPVSSNLVKDPTLDFKNAVNARSRVCSALLVNSKLNKPENGLLQVVLEQEFAVNKLREEKNMAILLEAAKEVFGKVARVIVNTPDKTGKKPESSKPQNKISHREQIAQIDEAARKKVLQKPAIADAIDVFGGEILDIEN